jgi:hypothetical protein
MAIGFSPVLIRDIVFYLCGFVYGIAESSTQETVDFYERLQTQNSYIAKYNLRTQEIKRMEALGPKQTDIELMFLKYNS